MTRVLDEDVIRGMSGSGFQEIRFGSPEYHLECELRNEVLRRPLGLNLFDEDLAAESSQSHFGLFDGETLLACVIAVPLTKGEVKLRQMAVAPSAQGRGLGRLLLEALEHELVTRGFEVATLHARAGVLDFYGKLGFRCEGGEFLEVGIPHRRMRKILAALEIE